MSKLLVVVDAQNDFITGALGSMAAEVAAYNVVDKINSWDGQFAFTMDTHDSSYLDTLEGKHLPVKHCIIGTDGFCRWEEINQAVMNLEVPYLTIYKDTFGSIELLDRIKFNEYDEIQLVGFCTDICVIANAILMKTYFKNTKIVVDSQCCAGSTPENHLAALQVMKSLQIEVI